MAKFLEIHISAAGTPSSLLRFFLHFLPSTTITPSSDRIMSNEEHDLLNHRLSLTPEPVPQRLATARITLPAHIRKSYSRRHSRPCPYPKLQHSLHQLNVTHPDPATIEELIQIIRPRSPRRVLAAVLEPPPPGLHDRRLALNGDVERRPVHWMLAMIMDFVEAVKRAILGA
ncbi:hypothetical protein LshimejAT787_0308640 [Lyophyllum shimeji]|uniref:Uncharacterized protein n=1 Tax=Lyophyllum shimeji TaxID=47721 RepID=A0A9P3PIU8_LYOSH|nr:hypothetical protein LshimejAT787_0308640 [Lyophyllum shimeji]